MNISEIEESSIFMNLFINIHTFIFITYIMGFRQSYTIDSSASVYAFMLIKWHLQCTITKAT